MNTLVAETYRNPKDGTEIAVSAGEPAHIELTIVNDANRPRLFSAQLMGIPDSWVDPSTLDQRVGAQGEHLFQIHIAPPRRAPGGSHRVNIRLLVEGEYDDSLPEFNVVLEVQPLAEAEPVAKFESDVKSVVEPEIDLESGPVLTSAPPDPAPQVPISDEAPSIAQEPRRPAPEAVQAQPTQQPTLEPFPEETPPSAPTSEPKSPAPKSPSPREPEQPRVVSLREDEDVEEPVEPLPEPKVSPPTPPKQEKAQKRVIDLPEEEDNEEEEQDESSSEDEESRLAVKYKQVIKVGEEVPTLWMKPGESVILLFPFKNEGNRQANYIIEEDHSLEIGWVQLVDMEINLPSGKSGFVSASVTVPAGTRPDTFQFQVRVGPRGGPLRPFDATLVIDPQLSLSVQAQSREAWIGPVSRSGDFTVRVQSTGNADTAYRLAFDHYSAEDEGGFEPIYEVPHWRYQIDKEVENLKSPVPGRPPVTQSHRVTIRREGIWWIGWVESHKARVVGMPVTDRSWRVSQASLVELTLKRWRILPFPWFVSVILIGLFLTSLGGSPSDFVVSNALLSDVDGHKRYLVLDTDLHDDGKIPFTVQLGYKAPRFASVSIHRNRGDNTESLHFRGSSFSDRGSPTPGDPGPSVDGSQYQAFLTYTASSLLGAGKTQSPVTLVPWRTDSALDVQDEAGKTLVPIISDMVVGSRKVHTANYTIHTSLSKVGRIQFFNKMPSASQSQVQLMTVHWPAGFEKDDRKVNMTWRNEGINPTARLSPKLYLTDIGEAAKDSTGWLLVTTDKAMPIIDIHLAFDADLLPTRPSETIRKDQPIEPQPDRHLKQVPVEHARSFKTENPALDPKKSILGSVRLAAEQFYASRGIAITKDKGVLKFDVATNGSLWMLGDYACLKAAAGGAGVKVCALVHRIGGKWSLVQIGPESEAGAIMAAHPEAPSEIFK